MPRGLCQERWRFSLIGDLWRYWQAARSSSLTCAPVNAGRRSSLACAYIQYRQKQQFCLYIQPLQTDAAVSPVHTGNTDRRSSLACAYSQYRQTQQSCMCTVNADTYQHWLHALNLLLISVASDCLCFLMPEVTVCNAYVLRKKKLNYVDSFFESFGWLIMNAVLLAKMTHFTHMGQWVNLTLFSLSAACLVTV